MSVVTDDSYATTSSMPALIPYIHPFLALYTLTRTDSSERVKEVVDQILLNENAEIIFEDLIVIMFHIRNVDAGRGDRALFHKLFNYLHSLYPVLMTMLLELVPQYGYWKDFFVLAGQGPLLRPALEIAAHQLEKDEQAVAEGRRPSLFVRWCPKEGKKHEAFAKAFANRLFPDTYSYSERMKLYRKRLAPLNAALGTVEIDMCAKRWENIHPILVPVLARQKYRAAFMNENGLPIAPVLRAPNDPARMICRSRFQSFYSTPYPPGQRVKITIQSPRYAIIRQRVKEWSDLCNY